MATCLHRLLRVGARQYVRTVQTHPQLQLGAAFISHKRGICAAFIGGWRLLEEIRYIVRE